jgi:outer membrane protein assembly factor BamD
MMGRLMVEGSRLVAVALVLLLVAGCSTLDSWFSRTPADKMTAEQLYAEAQNELASGNWVRARENLNRLESRYPFGRYAQQAQIEIAYAYYKEGDQAQAIAACDRFLKLNPNHPFADYVLYLKGLATFSDELGLFGRQLGLDPSTRDPKAMRDAFAIYRELVGRFPDSKYAPDATARMNYLVTAMAQSEVNVARFYLERGAYVAAVDRAQTAVRNYAGTDAAEEALSIMMRAYTALALPKLAEDTRRVLELNYPNSRFLASAKR